MKKITLAFLLMIFCNGFVKAQIGIGTSSPNAKAALEVYSTSKGFLPPRLTYAEKIAITSPPAGLVLWCSNCGSNGELQVYNGNDWVNMVGSTASPEVIRVGNPYLGGIVAYILVSGDPGYNASVQHGLIATTADKTAAIWGCSGTSITTSEAIGSGNSNTTAIITTCTTAGIAAKVCADLVEGGYSDWYLPSRNELTKLYTNKTSIGGFADAVYLSSTHSNATAAIVRDFTLNGGGETEQSKATAYKFRPVRSF